MTETVTDTRTGREVNKAPAVQDDTIEPTMSHATDEGLIFDSKSKLYEHYKQNGYECTGGDHLTGSGIGDKSKRKTFDCPEEIARKAEWGMLKVDPEIKGEVMEAARKIKWGMAPQTEMEKQRCLEEKRRYRMYEKNNLR